MKANVIVFEASILILTPFFYAGTKRYLGRSRSRVFLLGSVLFSLAIETGAVLGGVKNFYWYSLNSYYKHYPLGGYIIWLGLVPLAACLLFYMICASSYMAGALLAPRKGAYAQSAIAGLISVIGYLMIEPVAVTNHWWTWNVKSFYLLDFPVLTLVGVFLAVFLFTITYQITIMELGDFKILSKFEEKTIKRWPIKSSKSTHNLSWIQLIEVFTFRCIAALAVFSASIAPIMVLLWVFANRAHIKPGW